MLLPLVLLHSDGGAAAAPAHAAALGAAPGVSVNSRLQVRGGGGETHIWGVNLMHFLTFFIFWVFLWGEFGILGGGGNSPPGDSWK